MKVLALAALSMLLSGCGMQTIHTEKYSQDSNGDWYERHYLVIPYDSAVKGNVDGLHSHETKYNYKTHKME